uniref:Uncharacterized protein n=1 Tax=Neogobius melanostomus TaxID=47308 RepID=A0A8C6SK79_9GOBI
MYHIFLFQKDFCTDFHMCCDCEPLLRCKLMLKYNQTFLYLDASREINGLFAKFADVLSEKAATDTSMNQELEGILNEARNLEAHLLQKKKRLKQTLAQISDKLNSHEG